MAVATTVTKLRVSAVGDVKLLTANVALSGTYTTGGDFFGAPAATLAASLAILGLENAVDAVIFELVGAGTPTTAFVPAYNHNTGKLQLFSSNGAAPAALAEVAAATAVGTPTYRMIAIGKGSATGVAR